MSRTACFRMIAFVMVLLALTVGQMAPAFAQTAENEPPAGDTVDAATADPSVVVEEKSEFTPGDANTVDAGKRQLFMPLVTGGAGTVDAAATTAAWQNVFLDEFCGFPAGWGRYDYNATGHLWTNQIVDGFCTAKPNGYTHKMNTYLERSFSLVGATSARMTFRFKMSTETGFDYLRYEYSCNNRKTWQGTTHADSGVYAWTTRTISLNSCDGSSAVWVRFTFQTDQSVLGAAAPALDYVQVQKFQ